MTSKIVDILVLLAKKGQIKVVSNVYRRLAKSFHDYIVFNRLGSLVSPHQSFDSDRGLLGINKAVQLHTTPLYVLGHQIHLGMSGSYWYSRTAGALDNSIKSES
jgi:hypothetical protein